MKSIFILFVILVIISVSYGREIYRRPQRHRGIHNHVIYKYDAIRDSNGDSYDGPDDEYYEDGDDNTNEYPDGNDEIDSYEDADGTNNGHSRNYRRPVHRHRGTYNHGRVNYKNGYQDTVGDYDGDSNDGPDDEYYEGDDNGSNDYVAYEDPDDNDEKRPVYRHRGTYNRGRVNHKNDYQDTVRDYDGNSDDEYYEGGDNGSFDDDDTYEDYRRPIHRRRGTHNHRTGRVNHRNYYQDTVGEYDGDSNDGPDDDNTYYDNDNDSYDDSDNRDNDDDNNDDSGNDSDEYLYDDDDSNDIPVDEDSKEYGGKYTVHSAGRRLKPTIDRMLRSSRTMELYRKLPNGL